jgi:hypothetical protein
MTVPLEEESDQTIAASKIEARMTLASLSGAGQISGKRGPVLDQS